MIYTIVLPTMVHVQGRRRNCGIARWFQLNHIAGAGGESDLGRSLARQEAGSQGRRGHVQLEPRDPTTDGVTGPSYASLAPGQNPSADRALSPSYAWGAPWTRSPTGCRL